ncbi:MAG TPA: geranylgeranylglycerol-phosphate geranylgeranyltransferase [Ignavibacteriaceae bacterium]|nr:geranylgeranylglycerol-phosphate geranylgeranyltransferase [Ignavibacteriaceae bacterium]
MKEKLIAIIKITRPVNFLITFASVIVSAIICAPENLLILKVFLATLSAGLAASAGNIINDIFDIEIDRINQPQRPLPSGTLTIKEAYSFYFVCLILSVILSVFVSYFALIIVVVSNLILIVYSKYLKRIPLVGNITVAFLTGLVFIFGGVVVENPSAAIIPASFALMINLIRELVKDMQDVEGDKGAGIITFPIKFGFLRTKYLMLIPSVILIIMTTIPFIYEIYKIEYFVVVMVIVNPLLIFTIKKLFDDDSLKNLIKISNLLKLNMIFGLIAIFLGK